MFYSNYIDPERPVKKPTAAMEFGSHAHLRLLEPNLFDSSFCVAPDTAENKVCKEWKQFKKKAEEEGKTPLLKKEFDKLALMAAQVKRHELARKMLLDGKVEHSFFWKDDASGLILKARPDNLTYITNNEGEREYVIVDYKTTYSHLSNEIQSREAFNQKRYIQGAFHKYVVEKATGAKIKTVCYVTQMTEYPYLVRCFEMQERELQIGLDEIKESLSTIKEYYEKGVWEDYPHDIQPYQAPAWFEYKYN